jgi:hypothetical protein
VNPSDATKLNCLLILLRISVAVSLARSLTALLMDSSAPERIRITGGIQAQRRMMQNPAMTIRRNEIFILSSYCLLFLLLLFLFLFLFVCLFVCERGGKEKKNKTKKALREIKRIFLLLLLLCGENNNNKPTPIG